MTDANTNRGVRTIRTEVRLIAKIADVARLLWPHKCAPNIATRTGFSIRAAEYWLAAQRDMPLEAAAKLLRSEDGMAFLEALIGDDKPEWWRSFLAFRDREQIRRQIRELERKLGD